jgi:2-polyprenyl-3-methyl-5-hydroxy-6-metoxy-1,4-benzoquinol methylase
MFEGWSAVGIDLNEGLIESANNFWGFNALQAASINDLLDRGLRFDAIYSNQVFEHLRKPVAAGSALMKLLKPGGVVYIDVPNAAQFTEHIRRGATLDPTSHFNHFTIGTLRQLLELIGGECVYSSAAPGLFRAWCRVGLTRFAVPLTRATRMILPGIGAGVVVIGRKASGA